MLPNITHRYYNYEIKMEMNAERNDRAFIHVMKLFRIATDWILNTLLKSRTAVDPSLLRNTE